MEDKHRALWLCRRTVLEMLRDRGYAVNSEEIETPLEKFKETYPNVHLVPKPLEQLFTKSDFSILLHFVEEPKLSVKNIKPILEAARQLSVAGLLLVIQEGMSSQVADELKNTGDIDVEVFKMVDLMFNVTKHELVPKHRIMTPTEKQGFFHNKKMREGDLPQISLFDPVVRYLRGRKGDLVEIERKSETTGISYYYRVVV